MIKRIEINIPGYVAFFSNCNSVVNDKNVIIDGEDLDNLLRIILAWDDEYLGKTIISGEKYFIVINDGKEHYKFFINKFPKDFYKLTELLGDFYVRG